MIIKGTVAVVTGGASGLGEATLRCLHDQGAYVTFIDLNEARGKEIEAELGEKTMFLCADVSREEEVQTVINKTLARFGALHIVCNIAGISIPRPIYGKRGAYSLEAYQKVINVNLIGTFNFMRLGAEAMIKNEPNQEGERGVIVNTSSIASFHGEPGQCAYSASKGAINSMMLPAARDLAKYGIRNMAIAPGIFYTPIYETISPQVIESLKDKTIFPKRFGRPDEFAQAVRFIIENQMLNGDVIRLDGAVRF